MTAIDTTEAKRLEIQAELDNSKTQDERNKLGQFATPPALAKQILEQAVRLHPEGKPVRFLEPAIGTGSFFSALLRAFPATAIESAVGFETDPECVKRVHSLWRTSPLKLREEDFTKAAPPTSEWAKPNLIVCNPPYVRHHHLTASDKLRLKRAVQQVAGVKLSGLAGLYCYFLCLTQAWMAKDSIAGWLIPSEFMDVNYGQQVKDYLLSRVTLLRVHRFDPNDVQFADALVSSAIVWIRNTLPTAEHVVEFTYGGTLQSPEHKKTVSAKALRREAKWTKFSHHTDDVAGDATQIVLSDLFKIQRGLATGENRFFIMSREQAMAKEIPQKFLRPILPSPRYLEVDEVPADGEGNPVLNRRLFLLSCDLPESEVKAKYPPLWKYFQLGVENGIQNGYLCTHRSPWYAQENRPASPFLCTYMGRHDTGTGRPFRFILNHSKATAPNVYLMLYPKPFLQMAIDKKPEILRDAWNGLNRISTHTLTREGRVYGGGLYKLEPRELGNVPATGILSIATGIPVKQTKQLSLVMEKLSHGLR
jgi:predicted RNA methylase